MSSSTKLPQKTGAVGSKRLWNETHVGLRAKEFMAFIDTLPKPQRDELWRARLELVAARLKERCSHIPWYQERAKDDPDYWMRVAASEVHAV